MTTTITLTTDTECPSRIIAAWNMEAWGYTRLSDAVRKFNTHGMTLPKVQGGHLLLRANPEASNPAFDATITASNYRRSSYNVDAYSGITVNTAVADDDDHRYSSVETITGIRDLCDTCGHEACFVRPAAFNHDRTAGICGKRYPADFHNPTLTGDICPAYEAKIDCGFGNKVPEFGMRDGVLCIVGLKTLRNRSKNRHEWRHGRGTKKNPCECGRPLCWGNPKRGQPCTTDEPCDFALADVYDGDIRIGVVLGFIEYRNADSAEVIESLGPDAVIKSRPMICR